MKEFQENYKSCSVCDKCTNSCKVFGHGNINADIMVIGDSPKTEDIDSNTLFSGPTGELFDKILSSIDLKKDDLYFTSTILCKTNEKDRSPSWEEIENCSARLDEEINIVKPNIILMVGSQSLKRFFGRNSKISECHGRWFIDFKPPYARYFSIMHPSWILYSSTPGEEQAKKRTIWENIKTFKKDLEVSNFEVRR